MKKLSDILQYDARISLLWFTMLRNFGALLALTHIEACTMYFLARLHNFDEKTWLGPVVADMDGLDRYVTSLYLVSLILCLHVGDAAPNHSCSDDWLFLSNALAGSLL